MLSEEKKNIIEKVLNGELPNKTLLVLNDKLTLKNNTPIEGQHYILTSSKKEIDAFLKTHLFSNNGIDYKIFENFFVVDLEKEKTQINLEDLVIRLSDGRGFVTIIENEEEKKMAEILSILDDVEKSTTFSKSKY